MNDDLQTTLQELAATIESRRNANPADSYTAALLGGAEDALLKKIMEEAGEAVLAAKSGDKTRLTAELADLLYHCLVVMTRYNIRAEDIAAELTRRRTMSGHAEKETRQKARQKARRGK